MARYFKRTKNGTLDSVGRAKTEAYAQMLIEEGYVETTQEYYERIMRMDLYISYRIE